MKTKRMFWAFLFSILFTLSAPAQNQPSNTVTVQVVAPPSWTITVSPLSYYQNQSKVMTITVTQGTVASTCTATWDSTPMTLTFPSPIPPTNPVVLTAQVTAAMTVTLGSHTVFIACPLPQLSLLSPVTLPNAVVGKTYSANLKTLANVQGGVPPYTFTLVSGALPTGLSLSSVGVVAGTPSGAACSVPSGCPYSFDYTVKDSSGLALKQEKSIVLSARAQL